MDISKLTEEIIEGRRLGREEDLSFFQTCELAKLTAGADRLRRYFSGDRAMLKELDRTVIDRPNLGQRG